MSPRKKKRPGKVADLRPDPENPRVHEESARAGLADSMQEFGDLSGIVFNRRTGQLVGGHMRRDALPAKAKVTVTEEFDPPTATGTVAIGYVTTDEDRWTYREVEWDQERQRAANIAANNPHLQGRYDYGMLAQRLEQWREQGLDWGQRAGFSPDQIDGMIEYAPGMQDVGSAGDVEDPHDDDLHHTIRFLVEAPVYDRWRSVWDDLPGDTDSERAMALLDRLG